MALTLSPRIRTSPFYEAAVRAGLSDFTIYNKMVLPTSFGDLDAEYDRLLNAVAIWDVGSERQVQIVGPDAHACAQYLSARDLTKMVEGQGKYVAMCDHDGRILNDPVLMKLSGNRFWFSLADHDMLLWCKAIANEKGFDVDVTEPDVSPLAVQGPLATDLVADLFGDHVRELKYFWFIETELEGIPLVLCRSGWSKQGGFELFLQDGSRGTDLWDLVVAAGDNYGIGPGAPNHIERVESGLLSWGGDTTYDSNPFEAGMGNYTDVDTAERTVPDYIGKPALQRVAADGPERLLVGLVVDDVVADVWPLPKRTPVTLADGQQVGTLSALVNSPRMAATIGLAQVSRTVVEQDRPVVITGPDQSTFTATLRELPFL